MLCIVVAALLTSGSTARRLAQAALPQEAKTISGSKISISRVDVDEGVSDEIRIELLAGVPKAVHTSQYGGDQPRILIYHTHTTEAYTQTETYTYRETSRWRTNEQDKGIVAVGALLAKILREEYGCNVIHDTTDHEPPKLATSYSRSVKTMEAYQEKYPSITLFIDVHRDAGQEQRYVTIDGKQVARMMFVVGTGEGATGTGFAQMPDFESNYALAHAVTEQLAAVNESLTRNIRVKTGRYNQHISNECLLLEVGDNRNTLEQALNAVPYFARALMESVQRGAEEMPASDPTPGLLWTPQ